MLDNNTLFTQNKQNGGGVFLLLSKISSRYAMLGGVSK